jgi:hypothetical protein
MTPTNTVALAMEIQTQEEADACFEALVAEAMTKAETDRAEAERRVRFALGYFAGYYGHEVRERVERLFRCEHPIFGPVANGVPSPDEIFRLGMSLSRRST